MKKGFFAYSSRPEFCEDAIENAITQINGGGVANISSWKQLRVNGKFIINEVLEAIFNADFFCADLTGINDNVLFEIGYAIGINKPVWLIFDTSHIESYRRYREIDFFSTIGYSKYSNTNHIVSNFYTDNPYDKKGAYEELTKNITSYDADERYPLLFLKNQVDTNYSESVIKSLKEKKLTYVLDDAFETKTQSISWYLARLLRIPSVLAEFSTTERTGYAVQNSKCSLICGLSLGLGLKVLMVCEEPYATPLDYKELLKKHKTPSECKGNVDIFLDELKQNYFELSEKREKFKINRKGRNALHCINFGEFLAEHEGDKLRNYYIETTASSNLLKNEYNVVVGRKGSGKTATLYYLEDYLKSDARNHVCTIKPISFELEGLLHVLSTIPENFEKSYLIESAWKLLIYTEIAKSIYEKLKTKVIFALSENEKNFISFIEDNREIFFTDFYERTEENLKRINRETNKADHREFKVKVSEILHVQFLSKVRDQICAVYDKNIYVLLDNLDKSWKKEAEIEYQSKWILGLLGLTIRITREFSSSRKNNKNNEFHLTIFLRSDIFHHILRYAREPDKIEYTKLKIEDKETLFRIIEERFVELSGDEFVYDDLWNKYLPKNIDGIDVKTFIYNNIIPRPRDIILFFNKIKDTAILRGHTTFIEDDVKDAYNEYSEWVFSSILVENGITIKQMEDFLYELVGECAVFTRSDIVIKANNAKINFKDEDSKDKFIDHLVALSILGREIKPGEFSFNYDLENNRKSAILAKKLGTNNLRLHNALIPALEINTGIAEPGGQAERSMERHLL